MYSSKVVAFNKKNYLILKVFIMIIKLENIIYKKKIIVGLNNKCHIYRSVGGSSLYIL